VAGLVGPVDPRKVSPACYIHLRPAKDIVAHINCDSGQRRGSGEAAASVQAGSWPPRQDIRPADPFACASTRRRADFRAGFATLRRCPRSNASSLAAVLPVVVAPVDATQLNRLKLNPSAQMHALVGSGLEHDECAAVTSSYITSRREPQLEARAPRSPFRKLDSNLVAWAWTGEGRSPCLATGKLPAAETDAKASVPGKSWPSWPRRHCQPRKRGCGGGILMSPATCSPSCGINSAARRCRT